MSAPNINFEGHFTSYVFGRGMLLHVLKLKGGCFTSRLLLWKNKWKFSDNWRL